MEKELKSLQESHARLLSSAAQGRYRFAAPTQLSSSLAAPVQAALGPSRVLVEYLVTDDKSYAFVVSAGGINVVRLPIGRAALRDQVQHLLAPFHQARTGEVDLTRLELNTSAAHALYQAIFAPVRPHLGAANIVVVPDDALNLLPFEALVETAPDSTPRSQVLHGQFADVSFLVRRFDISYLNSSAQLLAAKMDEAPAAPKRLFAMANPTGWVTSLSGDPGTRTSRTSWAFARVAS